MKKLLIFMLALAGLNFVFAEDTTGTGATTPILTSTTNTGTNIQYGELYLKTKITANYKVEAEWNSIKIGSGDELANYVLLVSNTIENPTIPAQDGVTTTSVKGDKTHVDDWNAKPGKNYYVICAVMYSGKTICSKPNIVMMGNNGEPAYGTRNNQYTGDRPYMSGDNMSGYNNPMKIYRDGKREAMSGDNMSGMRDHIHDNKMNMKENRMQILANWEKFHSEYGYIWKFTKQLTGDEKKQVEEIIKNYKQQALNIIKTAKEQAKTDSGFNMDGVAADLKALGQKLVTDLTPYIDPNKLEEFKTFVEQRYATMQANIQIKKDNIDIKRENKDIKKEMKRVLSQKTRENFIAKLNQIPDDQKQEVLNKILQKVETLKTKYAGNQKILDILAEIEEIIRYMLSKTSDSDAQSIINEITQ